MQKKKKYSQNDIEITVNPNPVSLRFSLSQDDTKTVVRLNTSQTLDFLAVINEMNETIHGAKGSITPQKYLLGLQNHNAYQKHNKTQPNPKTPWADNPQAVEIDALIERAGRLTVREAEALIGVSVRCEDKDVAIAAARYTAIATNTETVSNAATGAAWNAPISTVYDVSNVAAGVAMALSLRHFVHENSVWNQKAYNTLTRPWAKVVGKVHPDD